MKKKRFSKLHKTHKITSEYMCKKCRQGVFGCDRCGTELKYEMYCSPSGMKELKATHFCEKCAKEIKCLVQL